MQCRLHTSLAGLNDLASLPIARAPNSKTKNAQKQNLAQMFSRAEITVAPVLSLKSQSLKLDLGLVSCAKPHNILALGGHMFHVCMA